MSISERVIRDTPIAIVDLETTGLYAGGDRIVEIAIVRADPTKAPKLQFETLVNPRRAVSATEIHGITDSDVADAPTFDELVGNVVSAISGAVFSSYNVYFDAKFVRAELAGCGVPKFPPHFCLMYLRPLLGLGKRCSLVDACAAHAVERTGAHMAGSDALAAARLWQFYVASLEAAEVVTFGDLSKVKSYKFMESFSDPLYEEKDCASLPSTNRFKRRNAVVASKTNDSRVARHQLLGEYWDCLTAALSDFAVTDEEVELLRQRQRGLAITEDELRWMHARAFAGLLSLVCQDQAVTVDEVWALRNVTNALRAIGWAPGDVVTELRES